MTANPQTVVRVPAEVRQWLRHRAADRDCSLSRVVEDLAREAMQRDGAPRREEFAR